MYMSPMQFTAIRVAKCLFKQTLEIVDEIKTANDAEIQKLAKTLQELEIFIKKESGISVSLAPYAKFVNVLDEDKNKQIRKRVLDYGNALIREIETQK